MRSDKSFFKRNTIIACIVILVVIVASTLIAFAFLNKEGEEPVKTISDTPKNLGFTIVTKSETTNEEKIILDIKNLTDEEIENGFVALLEKHNINYVVHDNIISEFSNLKADTSLNNDSMTLKLIHAYTTLEENQDKNNILGVLLYKNINLFPINSNFENIQLKRGVTLYFLETNETST